MSREYIDANGILECKIDLQDTPAHSQRGEMDYLEVLLENLSEHFAEIVVAADGRNEYRVKRLESEGQKDKIKIPLYDSTGVIRIYTTSPNVLIVATAGSDRYGKGKYEWVVNAPHQRYNVLTWEGEIVGEKLNAKTAMEMFEDWPDGKKPPRLEVANE